MSQQQHPRLRPVDFPLFPVYGDAGTNDTKAQSRTDSPQQVETVSCAESKSDHSWVHLAVIDKATLLAE